jgi:hypothetical protein
VRITCLLVIFARIHNPSSHQGGGIPQHVGSPENFNPQPHNPSRQVTCLLSDFINCPSSKLTHDINLYQLRRDDKDDQSMHCSMTWPEAGEVHHASRLLVLMVAIPSICCVDTSHKLSTYKYVLISCSLTITVVLFCLYYHSYIPPHQRFDFI